MRNLTFGDLMRRPEAGALLGLLAVLIFFVVFGGINFLKPMRHRKLAERGCEYRYRRAAHRAFDDRGRTGYFHRCDDPGGVNDRGNPVRAL